MESLKNSTEREETVQINLCDEKKWRITKQKLASAQFWKREWTNDTNGPKKDRNLLEK